MNPHEELKQIFADRKPVDVAIEISGFTGHRTTLVDELTDTEVSRLLAIYCPSEKVLEAECNALKEDILKKSWKSKILKLAEDTGLKEKGSFHKFNNWMLLSSVFKKHLNAHSILELQLLHKQLHAVRTNNARSAQKPMTKAWWEKAEKNVNLN